MPVTTCMQCHKPIEPDDPRFAFGSGWVCFACGEATREVSTGYDALANVAPRAAKPRLARGQRGALLAIVAAGLLLPAAGALLVFTLVPKPPSVAQVPALDLPSPDAPAVSQSAPRAPVTPPDVGAVPQSGSHASTAAPARPSPAIAPAAPESVVPTDPSDAPTPPAPDVATPVAPAPPIVIRVAPADTEPLPSVVTERPAPKASPKPADAPAAVTDGPTPEGVVHEATADPRPMAVPDPLQEMCDKATRALALGELDTAADLYRDVLRADPKNERAAVGRGLIAYFQGAMDTAIDRLETANDNNRTHLTSVNLASLYLNRNSMRSARLLVEYLSAANELDEEAYDYLTVALWRSHFYARDNEAFWQMVRFHELYEQRLRLARGAPDQRRWGREWIGGDDMQQRLQRLNNAKDQLAKANQQTRFLLRERRSLIAATRTLGDRMAVQSSLKMINDQLQQAQKDVRDARTNLVATAPWLGSDIPLVAP